MPKEWILNSVMNRFQLNFKRNVGPTSESIRKCSPKNIDEWRDYYFKNVKTKEHIIDLGKKLYTKITEVIPKEVEEITEQDCINYMILLVIDRTYDGYTTEIKTIYGRLEVDLGVKIDPASDEWDRLYNVDFYIRINNKYIGLQIKPVSDVSHITVIYQQRGIQAETHKRFTDEFGGKVFYVYSIKNGNTKVISNPEVVDDIKKEIERLKK